MVDRGVGAELTELAGCCRGAGVGGVVERMHGLLALLQPLAQCLIGRLVWHRLRRHPVAHVVEALALQVLLVPLGAELAGSQIDAVHDIDAVQGRRRDLTGIVGSGLRNLTIRRELHAERVLLAAVLLVARYVQDERQGGRGRGCRGGRGRLGRSRRGVLGGHRCDGSGLGLLAAAGAADQAHQQAGNGQGQEGATHRDHLTFWFLVGYDQAIRNIIAKNLRFVNSCYGLRRGIIKACN